MYDICNVTGKPFNMGDICEECGKPINSEYHMSDYCVNFDLDQEAPDA